MVAIARELVKEYSSRDIPVFEGPRRKLDNQETCAPWGETSFRRFKNRVLSHAPDALTVACIGPATACVCMLQDEEVRSRIRSLYLEMGQWGDWQTQCGFDLCEEELKDAGHVGDFNFNSDVASVDWILNHAYSSYSSVYFVPFQQLVRVRLCSLDHHNTLDAMSSTWFDFWTSKFTCSPCIYLWDVAVIEAIASSQCVSVQAHIEKCDEAVQDQNSSQRSRLVLQRSDRGTRHVVTNIWSGSDPSSVRAWSWSSWS